MKDVEGEILGFRFMDNINIITWGDSAQENYMHLEEEYKRCMD